MRNGLHTHRNDRIPAPVDAAAAGGRPPAPPAAAVLDPLAELAAAKVEAPPRQLAFCARCGFSRILHAGVRGDGPSLVPGVDCDGFEERAA